MRNGDFLPLGFPGHQDLTDCAWDGDRMFVVGMGGVVYAMKDRKWEDLKAPTGTDLYAVGAARGEVFAAGKGGAILYWNGEGWRVEFTGVKYDLYGIWFTNAAGPYVVGSAGMMLYRQGGVWMSRQIAYPSSTLYAMYRDPTGQMIAVGTRGLITTSHENDTWQIQMTNENVDPPRDLYAVAALGPKSVYVVGQKGAVFAFNGRRWTAAKKDGPYNTNVDLYAAAAWNDADGTARILAMGADGKGLILQDKSFVDAFAGLHSGLKALACLSDEVVAAGQDGVVLGWRDGHLSSRKTAIDGQINAISGRYAVGAKGMVLDMGTLQPVDACDLAVDLNGVVDLDDESIAVGAAGVVVHVTGDG